MAKIHDMMNETNCKIMAEELAIALTEQANQENIEYQWTVKKEDGKIESKDANTSFVFDPEENTMLYEFKTALCAKELENIEDKSLEEQELMTLVGDFMGQIGRELVETYREDIQEVVRRVVLGGKSDPNSIPLDTIEVMYIDIADYSSVSNSEKYLLKVFKEFGAEIETDEIVEFVHLKEEETQQSLETILTIERQAGNPLFERVTSLQRGEKFLNEITLNLFVDYSIKREETT